MAPPAATSAQPRYRARVTPRGTRGSRLSRIHWDRLGRVVLVIALIVIVLSYIRPALNAFDNWRESKAAEAELSRVQEENRRLERQAKALEGDAAMIVEARKLGLVSAGEKAYVVDGVR